MGERTSVGKSASTWAPLLLVAGLFVLTFLVARPAALIALAAVAAVTVAVLGVPVLMRRSRRIGSALLVVTAIGLVVVVAAATRGGDPRFGGSALEVITVPVNSTAQLDSDVWQIHDELTLDGQAREQLKRLGQDNPLRGSAWHRVRVVDGNAVFARDRTVPVEQHWLQSSQSSLQVPSAGTGRALLRPRSGSVFEILAPRGAISGTTPSSGEANATGQLRIWSTAVEIGDSTPDVSVNLVGSGLRSEAGSHIVGLLTWSPMSMLLTAGFCLAVGPVRDRVKRLLARLWGRVRAASESD